MPSLRSALACCLAMLALSWAAIVNGQPFFYPDTSAYVRSADMAFFKLTGVASPWTENRVSPPPAAPGRAAPTFPEEKVVLSGRSPYYGAVLFALDRTVGMWGVVLLQAALVLGCVFVTVQRLTPRPSTRTAAITAAMLLLPISATTTLSFYVGQLVPDILAPLAILAAADLLLPGATMRSASTAACVLLLLFAIVSHTSHFAIVAAILLAALALRLLGRPVAGDAGPRLSILGTTIPSPSTSGLRMIAALLVAGAVAEAAMTFAVTKALGAPPVRPPFLTARLMEDGTGARFLAKTCPGSGFAACAWANRTAMSVGQFLWNEEPGVGAFGLADAATKRALSAEQGRFALAVTMDDPIAQLAVSLRNWAEQAVRFGLRDFNSADGTRAFLREKLPADYAAVAMQTVAYRRGWPLAMLDTISTATVVVSGLFLLVVLLTGRRLGFAIGDDLRFVMLVVLFGVLMNAAVCGILSDPDDRYQARVIWLLPFLALLAWNIRPLRRGNESS